MSSVSFSIASRKYILIASSLFSTVYQTHARGRSILGTRQEEFGKNGKIKWSVYSSELPDENICEETGSRVKPPTADTDTSDNRNFVESEILSPIWNTWKSRSGRPRPELYLEIYNFIKMKKIFIFRTSQYINPSLKNRLSLRITKSYRDALRNWPTNVRVCVTATAFY